RKGALCAHVIVFAGRLFKSDTRIDEGSAEREQVSAADPCDGGCIGTAVQDVVVLISAGDFKDVQEVGIRGLVPEQDERSSVAFRAARVSGIAFGRDEVKVLSIGRKGNGTVAAMLLIEF